MSAACSQAVDAQGLQPLHLACLLRPADGRLLGRLLEAGGRLEPRLADLQDRSQGLPALSHLLETPPAALDSVFLLLAILIAFPRGLGNWRPS